MAACRHVTVPDCLKTGVVKCHLYDPDLNEDYAYLGRAFLHGNRSGSREKAEG